MPGVPCRAMQSILRIVLVGLLPILLMRCSPGDRYAMETPQAGPYSFEVFTLPAEGISMDYPAGWYVEDAHTSGSVGFFPWEPTPEDNPGPSASIQLAGHYEGQTLAGFAQSVREDIEDRGGPCRDPVSIQVREREGLMMECDPAWVIYFAENDGSRFAVFLDTVKLPEIVWTHMRDSIHVR